MVSQVVLSSAINVSEGRRPQVIDAIGRAAADCTALLHFHADPDHNRTVYTLCGPPKEMVQAVVALAHQAVERIDLRSHQGVHPRIGVVDVVPFTPRFGAPMRAAIEAAASCAHRLWAELGLPCFLYERSAASPERVGLPAVRHLAFQGMAPDIGGPLPHPSAGAVVVGARGPLVAYNVDLAGTDLAAARRIAAELRTIPSVRALGLMLDGRGCAQVSMNLTEPARVPVCAAYERTAALAAVHAAVVAASELVGVVSRADLGACDLRTLRLRAQPYVIEELYRAASN